MKSIEIYTRGSGLISSGFSSVRYIRSRKYNMFKEGSITLIIDDVVNVANLDAVISIDGVASIYVDYMIQSSILNKRKFVDVI